MSTELTVCAAERFCRRSFVVPCAVTLLDARVDVREYLDVNRTSRRSVGSQQMSAINRLLVRADASRSIGLGHVMRSVAYAEAARRWGIETLFVVSEDGLGAELAARRGFPVVEIPAPEDTSWARTLKPADVVLFDGYHFTSQTLDASAQPGVMTVIMDDHMGAGHVDVVICPERGDAPHRLPATCAALCGMTYAPIRSEFSSCRRLRGYPTERGALLVMLGGADTTGLTGSVVRAAQKHRPRPFSVIHAVLGPGVFDRELAELGGDVVVLRDPPRLDEVFDGAVAAISSAGTGAWELFCMGVPTAIIEVGPAQAEAARQASAAGAAMHIGVGAAALDAIPAAVTSLADPHLRHRLSSAALGFVDGHGADRVIEELDRHVRCVVCHEAAPAQ